MDKKLLIFFIVAIVAFMFLLGCQPKNGGISDKELFDEQSQITGNAAGPRNSCQNNLKEIRNCHEDNGIIYFEYKKGKNWYPDTRVDACKDSATVYDYACVSSTQLQRCPVQCASGLQCQEGQCVSPPTPGCTPNSCQSGQCGIGIPDGCGGTLDCGSCQSGYSCQNNQCVQQPQCSDSLDNDGDGKIDMNDPGCSSSSDNNEVDPAPFCGDAVCNGAETCSSCSADCGVCPQCNDGIDNDNDGKIDMNDPGCSSSSDNDENDSTPPGIKTWHIQYNPTPINPPADVEYWNLDLFDVSTETINNLKSKGVFVMCYFSAGSWENWRPDKDQFPPECLGNNNGWPGERWLDTRCQKVRDLMVQRIDLGISKGCDGFDPDNMDAYANNPGFNLTEGDAIDYYNFLANNIHSKGKKVGLKNALEILPLVLGNMDWAVNEQCYQYNECDVLKQVLNNGKPVFQIEYGDQAEADRVCPQANADGFSTLVKNLQLDEFEIACWKY